VPCHALGQAEVTERARHLFARMAGSEFERLMPVFAHAGIERRYSAAPLDWYERSHGWPERNALYIETSVALLESAAQSALAKAGLAPDAIDAIVTVSTTGIATPSLDALLMERMSFRREVQRLPIFGLGCAGGVLGLARAADLARAAQHRRVLLLVVELCALSFRKNDVSKSNIVATALFGDGAAAAILSCDGSGPRLGASGEYTWPNSLDIMGWDIAEDGFKAVFSRDIPALVRRHMRDVACDFLARHGLDIGSIDQFICHPGGVKVLTALEEAFRLPPGGLAHGHSVLRDYGNMSAATVLFVLERTLAAGLGERALMTTLGPGFTAGFLLLER
jgi:alkylresorcinol/alkylpyrone synthase